LFFSDFNSNTTSSSNYPGLLPIFNTTDLISVGEPINVTQRAVFGEASYKIIDQLKATVGLRYYRYTSKEEAINGDVLVYTTAAKGFRPGGPNTPVPLTGPARQRLE
jgi:iron complex outermembrane recepter protein